jgi:hypothetical protein
MVDLLQQGEIELNSVHEYAIPEDNPICDAAGLHFDPDNVGYAEPCYPLTPEKCQVRNSDGSTNGIVW